MINLYEQKSLSHMFRFLYILVQATRKSFKDQLSACLKTTKSKLSFKIKVTCSFVAIRLIIEPRRAIYYINHSLMCGIFQRRENDPYRVLKFRAKTQRSREIIDLS